MGTEAIAQVVSSISAVVSVVSSIGVAALSVFVAVKSFKWVRSAL